MGPILQITICNKHALLLFKSNLTKADFVLEVLHREDEEVISTPDICTVDEKRTLRERAAHFLSLLEAALGGKQGDGAVQGGDSNLAEYVPPTPESAETADCMDGDINCALFISLSNDVMVSELD